MELFEVRRNTEASPEAVFAVLADGWLFASWVVGAARVRAVDPGWPKTGARLHHSFGMWPVMLSDVSEVLIEEAPRRLVIRPKGWPLGEARVELRIDPWEDGSMITMTEDAVAGPGALVPQVLRQVLIAARNKEALRRLALLAEGNAGNAADAG